MYLHLLNVYEMVEVLCLTNILVCFFSDEKYDFDNPDWDIHVLTGSLKLFFRELMEPLIPYKQFEMLLTGISKSLSTIVQRL